eukprot:5507554-Pleurochrysis_carterae.AAC.2
MLRSRKGPAWRQQHLQQNQPEIPLGKGPVTTWAQQQAMRARHCKRRLEALRPLALPDKSDDSRCAARSLGMARESLIEIGTRSEHS